MDLWVRSQDKMNLVKIRQISLDYQNNKQIIANYVPDFFENSGAYYELLGTYKTKERALEVLNEIEKLIKPITIFQNCQVDKSTIEKIKEIGYCMVNNDARVEQISQAFYQMPEE